MQRVVSLLLALACTAATPPQQSEPDPEIPEHLRARWKGSDAWPVLHPDTVEINPSRILQTRATYLFEQGLHTDSPVAERRIWEIDHGTYYGTPLLILEQTDTGHADHPEVFARHTVWYVERDSYALKLILGADPLDATHRLVRFDPDGVVNTTIAADGSSTTTRLEGAHRAHSYRYYPQLLASMELHEGMTFRLTDFAFWDDSGTSDGDRLRVGGTKEISDLDGTTRRVAVVYWRTGPFETEYYLGPEWPYYFGQTVRHDRVENGTRVVYRETFIEAERIR